jgi:diaminopimelate epimerase
MLIPFTKMQGLGNDFVLLDERTASYGLGSSQMARLADRRCGIGCGQVLVLSPSRLADTAAKYSIFNADGSAAEHCGNGVRCVAKYLRGTGAVNGRELYIEIGGRRYALTFTDDDAVRVDMGCPQFAPEAIPIAAAVREARYTVEIDGRDIAFGSVSIGNPHAVILVDDVSTAAVASIGQAFQSHDFFPARVNVGFMQIVDPARVKLRVFERGVGETLACGTGACASVAVGRSWGLLGRRVAVELGGGTLTLEWSGAETESVWMTGPAESVFSGIIDL